MALPVGRTNFKKKEGILTITSDHQTVTWTPNSGGPPTVTLTVANITSKYHVPFFFFFYVILTCLLNPLLHRPSADAG